MKRLSNRKYKWDKVLWVIAFISFYLIFAGLFMAWKARAEEPEPFCKMWNTMGDDPTSDEPLTRSQRKMFHLGYYLTRSDFVRIMLNSDPPGGALFIDEVVTCYEENVPVLVEEVDFICQCSTEDKKEQVDKAFSNYVNDCIKEVRMTE